jgi:hypothetical protein
MRLQMQRGAAVLAAALAVTGLLTAAAVAASAAAPRNTALPTITGTARVTRTLTATNGTWENSPTSFQYQWQRCAADGPTGCANIAGAVRNTYVAVAADADHTLRVQVTAINADGATAVFSNVTAVVSANTPPRNTVRPTIAGTPQVGEELTANNGTWTGGVRSFAYQWQRCDDAGANCASVSGATGRVYGVRAADVDSTMRVEVTATNLAGSTSATSDRTAVVRASTSPPPPPSPPPATNKKPRLTLLSARYIGTKIYIRVRVCDEPGRKSLFERDSKSGVGFVTRRLASGTITGSCAVFARNWRPGTRFLRGKITVAVWARDAQGATSNRATFSLRR